ncbi:hypothetical protein, partial [Mesorhizobium sp. M4B.F.Ca.ET.049.02.1.2]|uniref:hypothetical protein n=1 Tax=Mesorhizobium sp. M4B.F.Ca.ET.049.02.1.2 TaxID=2496752 RepID=UPI001AECFC9A
MIEAPMHMRPAKGKLTALRSANAFVARVSVLARERKGQMSLSPKLACIRDIMGFHPGALPHAPSLCDT